MTLNSANTVIINSFKFVTFMTILIIIFTILKRKHTKKTEREKLNGSFTKTY
ncbi:hypothetical protein SAMN05421813_12637 [Daejeonella rubra]|uniref:Uncharacterized protein n=1 Tax=Daejeonella rubra TaxID=990371 RepID=A0A1G9WQJ4_9SPHI|nr:hypothetical protein SAMN05421813_12637 [Daejeonella rubra]